MRDGALFVNAGRGGTVDRERAAGRGHAAAPARRAQRSRPEPLPAGHPLWSAPGVLAITCRRAGDSHEAEARAVRLAVEQLRAYAAGQPLRNVRPLGS